MLPWLPVAITVKLEHVEIVRPELALSSTSPSSKSVLSSAHSERPLELQGVDMLALPRFSDAGAKQLASAPRCVRDQEPLLRRQQMPLGRRSHLAVPTLGSGLFGASTCCTWAALL